MTKRPEREKVPALRISPETINSARMTFGENDERFKFLEIVVESRLPYAVIAKIAGKQQDHVRDIIVGRKKYTAEEQVFFCQKMFKLIDEGLDKGLFPCTDLAVVEPITMMLLKNLLLTRQNDGLKQKLSALQPPVPTA